MVASRISCTLGAVAPARFNPLHCGAVVASLILNVSERGNGVVFQSPSLRGSGRFSPLIERQPWTSLCFNPLHCGAVVASRISTSRPDGGSRFQSPSLRGSGRFGMAYEYCLRITLMFQSPSLRGSGRFSPLLLVVLPGCCVSIPFIAGQWSLPEATAAAKALADVFQSPSLRGSGRFTDIWVAEAFDAEGFNPLHCGAVVASSPPDAAASGGRAGFNPLHCGAVVASWRTTRP